MKRFYTDVGVSAEAGRHQVQLDGRTVRTPARNPLALPTFALAEAVAQEWQAQGDQLSPAAMPLTKLATTALDLMPARRADAINEAAAYAATDLLCYRAMEPETLVARQLSTWQPWLDWAERCFDARLVVTSSVNPLQQPGAALRALRQAVEELDDWRLVGLHAAATLMGSLVLALALERQALDAEHAFAAALLDELYEIERWGEEVEQLRRHAGLRRDLGAADRFLRFLSASEPRA